MARISFEEWTQRADEYARKFYGWNDLLIQAHNLESSYDSQISPQEFVDDLADRFGLDSYSQSHQMAEQ